MKMRKINVGIADDHPVVLAGISRILKEESDIEVVFCADSISELLISTKTSVPDVLVCDYKFDDESAADGLNLIGRLRKEVPSTKLLIFSAYSDVRLISHALAAGASGFITKYGDGFRNLADAIRSVRAGRTYLPPIEAGTLLARLYNDGTQRKHGVDALSPREFEVVRLLCTGLSINEIADLVRRSPKTIGNQKCTAMQKLAAKNDVDLIKIARRSGIV